MMTPGTPPDHGSDLTRALGIDIVPYDPDTAPLTRDDLSRLETAEPGARIAVTPDFGRRLGGAALVLATLGRGAHHVSKRNGDTWWAPMTGRGAPSESELAKLNGGTRVAPPLERKLGFLAAGPHDIERGEFPDFHQVTAGHMISTLEEHPRAQGAFKRSHRELKALSDEAAALQRAKEAAAIADLGTAHGPAAITRRVRSAVARTTRLERKLDAAEYRVTYLQNIGAPAVAIARARAAVTKIEGSLTRAQAEHTAAARRAADAASRARTNATTRRRNIATDRTNAQNAHRRLSQGRNALGMIRPRIISARLNLQRQNIRHWVADRQVRRLEAANSPARQQRHIDAHGNAERRASAASDTMRNTLRDANRVRTIRLAGARSSSKRPAGGVRKVVSATTDTLHQMFR